MHTFTRYFWKQLTDDGRLIDAEWATPEGYEHSDEAVIHLHMKFSIDLSMSRYAGSAKWQLIKLYGLSDSYS